MAVIRIAYRINKLGEKGMPFKKKPAKSKEKKQKPLAAVEKQHVMKLFKVFATKDTRGKVKVNGEYIEKEVRVPIPFVDTLRRYASLSKGGAVEISAKGTENVIRAVKLFSTLSRRKFAMPERIYLSFKEGFVQLDPTVIEGTYYFEER